MIIVTFTWEDQPEEEYSFVCPYRISHHKPNGRRPTTATFRKVDIGPGGYTILNEIRTISNEEYKAWIKGVEYYIHPLKGKIIYQNKKVEEMFK